MNITTLPVFLLAAMSNTLSLPAVLTCYPTTPIACSPDSGCKYKSLSNGFFVLKDDSIIKTRSAVFNYEITEKRIGNPSIFRMRVGNDFMLSLIGSKQSDFLASKWFGRLYLTNEYYSTDVDIECSTQKSTAIPG